MTIERQHGLIIFTCDQENSARCEEILETETADWQVALRALTAEHWRAFRAGDTYVHCCSRCTVPRAGIPNRKVPHG